MELSVPLTVVPTLGEADVIRGFLETEGIPCSFSDSTAVYGEAGDWVELRVFEADLERARQLLDEIQSSG